MKMKEENKYEYQGKRKDQIEYSLKAVIIACLLFSLLAVVVVEVWNWLCG